MVDPLSALIAYLKADSALTALVGARVFGAELDRRENASMPRACVVVSPAGGGFIGLENQVYADSRVDVDCYGATPYAAWQVYLAAEEAMETLEREVYTDVLLHWAKPSARGSNGRTPDADWPIVLSSWQVLAGKVAAA